VIIKTISDDKEILNYSNSPMDTWQDGAEFARPKWGIYRSLKSKEDLQDEIVKYADFSINEIKGLYSVDVLKEKAERVLLTPNASSEIEFKNVDDYNLVELFDNSGRKIPIENKLDSNKLNVSDFSKGLYFLVFKKDNEIVKVLRCYIK